MGHNQQSRRNFLSNLAFGTATLFTPIQLFSGINQYGLKAEEKSNQENTLVSQAIDGKHIKAGLVGCGGRGTGAAINFFDSGPNLEIVSLGDLFQDQLDRCRRSLKKAREIEIKDENCFTGFDSYKKVIDSGIDVVLLATPPHFRPMHVKAAVEAHKHIFQEKPIAVDPSGARLMEENSKRAKEKELCIVSGTIRRYQKNYIDTQKQVQDGIIGEIIGATIIRNGGARWWVERRSEWTDMEYMIRNWGNFTWLSGDEIVEKLVHEIDVMSWHLGEHPEKAIGYGSQEQRIIGDQFDQFCIFYEYKKGKTVHCSIRAIDGCENGKKQYIKGTKGYADASGTVYNYNDKIIWEYPNADDNKRLEVPNPYVQEHVELVNAIRTGNYLNDCDEQIKSTRIAIMGRMAAYTGRVITWDEVLESDLKLGPDYYDLHEVIEIPKEAPEIGKIPASTARYQQI